MTVYARSDVVSVSLSTAHGGCGATHSRPVTHGAPDRTWQLDCPACENHLRTDPMWAGSPMEVPETPDEKLIREDHEKKGTTNREQQLMEAIVSMSRQHEDLPEALARAFALVAGKTPTPTAAPVKCPTGHDQPAGVKFCGECGHAMASIEEDVTATSPEEPDVADLDSMTVVQLRLLARQRDLVATGSKALLIQRLTEAK